MKKLTNKQKKFWDYLKGESNMKQRFIGNSLKKFMDNDKTKKLICNADHRMQIYLITQRNKNVEKSN
ncbi:MAG: hypothetical protein CBD62_00540 [Candidatus Pelagibacter sp. TMED202]|nr:MAG: hypothetical protein CBD62_00540 [Candidatus Pelagibacter sp. TMED202]|tara:strand:+ start:1455 stop:1655 length:201 start_codon:yes stop_codon:yes gene_type:complete